MTENQSIRAASATLLDRLRAKNPRVQCLTNTVAQQITANVLLALGARVSMATHPGEIIAMTGTADALLVNLGTPDPSRVDAIRRLGQHEKIRAMPCVLDPVFVEHSPLRMELARDVAGWNRVIVKANAPEAKALSDAGVPLPLLVVTGARDYVTARNGRQVVISNGDPMMAKVTGLGCATGAVIAAFAAVADDPVHACVAGLLCVEIAAEHAAHRSTGPGTFAAYLIDALATLEARDIASEAKIEVTP